MGTLLTRSINGVRVGPDGGTVVGSSGRPFLAQSLSAVAIAALDGVTPALGTATGEMVRHLVARYNTTPELRGLHRRTTDAVLQWARTEGLLEVDQGLSLAARTVGRYGLAHEQIAQEKFDPERVAARVLTAARKTDPDWGRRGFWRQRVQEDRQIVAERAIQETYGALIGDIKASEPVVLPALTTVLDDVGRLCLDLGDVAQDLTELRAALVRGATAGEVMAYLRTRITDWDSPVWSGVVPSSIERRLTVGTPDDRSGAESEQFTEQEALERQEMLVVLGGPGSGKTWLARRYARDTARAALDRLEAGANLDEVEIPLFTTWDRWAQTSGPGTRETLVASSFDPVLGHSDIAGSDLSGQLQRTLMLAETRVLLIVDSLDEAASRENQNDQGNRLHTLTVLSGERCRVVMTSRPSAWDSVRGRAPGSGGSLRVVSLHELRTDDVEDFVEAWFATDAGRAQALIEQLRNRPDLVRAVVVPLILTFYCTIAGEGPSADVQKLPVRRHALYARIVRRTFHHVDTAKGPGAATRDPAERQKTLAAWAWHAVGNANTPTGLGNWGETFAQPPGTYDDPALDAIAPKVRVDGEGVVTRRFQHRTLLEHFVAEYVADLPTDEAAEILLPHLWYDSDWAVAAPAAIAAHNRRRPGELLGRICDDFAANHMPQDTARNQISREFDRQLVEIAAESDPGEWVDGDQSLLNAGRVRHATTTTDSGPAWKPRLISRSAHWERSNSDVVAKVLEQLSDGGLVTTLAAALVLTELGPGLDARTQARVRTVVLNLLPAGTANIVWGRVEVLVSMGPSAEERTRARAALLSTLHDADPFSLPNLVQALSLLGLSAEEQARARSIVLEALITAPLSELSRPRLAEALLLLTPSRQDLAHARDAMLLALPHADIRADHLAEALLSLGPSDEERAQAWAAMAETLGGVSTNSADDLAAALLSLTPSSQELADVRSAVLEALPDADAYRGAGLVRLLLSLGPSREERARARDAVLLTLPHAGSWAEYTAEALLSLGPTDHERARTRARIAVLSALGDKDTRITGEPRSLMKLLLSLRPTSEERARMRAVFLAEICAGPYVADQVGALLSLGPRDEERAQARAAVLSALADTEDTRGRATLVKDLVGALLSLGPRDEERAQARAAVLSALADTEDTRGRATLVKDLVGALVSLRPTTDECGQAWTAVLEALPGAAAYEDGLVDALLSLKLADPDRARARAQTVEALSTGSDACVATLIVGLRRSYPLQEWLDLIEDGPARRPQRPTT
ncbi:NACHT domain-containing protein [Promicromonospora sp. NPDC023987]|uniref:NACHT domain-containing protein n=1 Tax=Promicromonospora sp. NPDC023987 TaxID=3155360 RepID=UPI0033DC352C